MQCAPCAISSSMIARRRPLEMPLPKLSWLILPFWQKTQPRLQPEKKMQPAPLVPESTGSSQWWSIARPTTMPAGMRQKPPPCSLVRSAPQRRGQRLQIIRSA